MSRRSRVSHSTRIQIDDASATLAGKEQGVKWFNNFLLTVLLAFALALALWSTSSHAAVAAVPAPAASQRVGVVTQDMVPLRAAASETSARTSVLWRGEMLELRGERGDYVQVWDHHSERGGYVLRAQVYPLDTTASGAPGLQTLLGFVSDQPGQEALGLSLAAASIQAMAGQDLQGPAGAAVLDAIARQADRLGERASRGAGERNSEQTRLTAHLDVAARFGVRYLTVEAGDGVVLCYEGDANRRLLDMPVALPAQRARAVLALTRQECVPSVTRLSDREPLDQERADWLLRVDPATVPAPWTSRLLIRRAEVWSRLAFEASRRGDATTARHAADVALTAMAAVSSDELSSDDQRDYRDAALRTNAIRWAMEPKGAVPKGVPLQVETQPDGQTCVKLHESRDSAKVLAQRCSWGQVWAASARRNDKGNAVVVSVQPVDGWRELWVFRQTRDGWTVMVQPPAALEPGVGYAEFAGWVPGGKSMLLAREANAEGRSIRRFEVVSLDSLTPQRIAFTPDALGPFNRWSDPAWKRESLALR